jgi:hypothetical protein
MTASLLPIVRRLCQVAVLCSVSLHAESNPIEAVEKAAGEWVRSRAETSRVQQEWAAQRQILESMVNALNERAQTLEARRDYLQVKTAKDREDLARQEATNNTATTGMQTTETQLKSLGAQLLQLRPSLPPRLSTALELPYKSLAATELSVSERMQVTMTVLNRCIQFNRGITSEQELLNPGGEKNEQLLEVIYWGLSHGYALDRAKGKAWFGSPGAGGWQWEPVPEGAQRVAELLAVYQSKSEPVFVEVPARLKGASADSPRK